MILYQDPSFSNSIAHGFFGARGGVSTGFYASLNCASDKKDMPENVHENRRRVVDSVGRPVDKLVMVSQVHSPDCLVVTEPMVAGVPRPKADAMATDVPGLMLGILTADCGPVLFEGFKESGEPVVAAAHAGWGGALGGVLEATVDQMIGLGALPESLRACVGPCIEQASYEVSAGFEAPFLARDPHSEHFFKASRREGHLMFDLPGYIAARLAQSGVGQVTLSGIDTYKAAEAGDCFSHRRMTHRAETECGRQISVIGIKN